MTMSIDGNNTISTTRNIAMRNFLTGLFALLLIPAAHAHTNEYLDTLTGAHGGQIRMAGPYHFEVVATPGEILVYVTDHGDTPIETAGASAVVVVQTGNTRTEIQLEPAGENVLRGSGKFKLSKSSTAELEVTMPDGPPQLATYKPVRKKRKAPK
jgi:hypothetical protein